MSKLHWDGGGGGLRSGLNLTKCWKGGDRHGLQCDDRTVCVCVCVRQKQAGSEVLAHCELVAQKLQLISVGTCVCVCECECVAVCVCVRTV